MVGIVEDVIIKIGELTIPTDFHAIKTAPSDKGGYYQVLLERPFLKTVGFRLNYFDEIFSFSMGNVIKIFQPTRPPIPKTGSIHHVQLCNQEGKEKDATKEIKQKKVEEKKGNDQKEKGSRITPPTTSKKKKKKKKSTKAVKKKKPEECKIKTKAELKYADFKDLIGKLKMINSALVKDGGIGVHLIEDNSKWK
ncbi:hypothetical protein PIB30_075293 [Stylosanthes scabra]|uniref:Uncharacterized protein n=1 Tax=Stylosanthes scabra TaxID=79078 RepID=A0ABU6RQN8_9FABA|nr:hypothetical protein [Stylosanthes scabra]